MNISFEEFKRQVLNDYKNVCLGRELRQAAAKERSIGSFTACSDVAQVALSKQFCETDWHTSAGIDTTFEIAAGIISPLDFFRRLYFSDFDLRMAWRWPLKSIGPTPKWPTTRLPPMATACRSAP